MLGLNGLIWFVGIANAEPPLDEVTINFETELKKEQEQNIKLEEELLQVTAALAERGKELGLHQDIITQLSIALDSRQEEKARVEAVRTLNDMQKYLAEEKVLPFYWELLGENQAISWAILDGMTSFSSFADVQDILQKGLYIQTISSQSQTTIRLGKMTNFGFYVEKPSELDPNVVLKTITVAGQIGTDEVALLLVNFTKDMSVPFDLRQAAFLTLETNCSEYLDKIGRYELEKESNRFANQIYAAAIGTTTSVLLGSVGVWGQSEVSEGLGYAGGMAMGATGGYLYADQLYRPTLGQSSLMASSVTWGIIEGAVLADALDTNDEQGALLRTAGVLGGAGYGYWQRNQDVATKDILELDFMGYWGAQMGVGLRDIVGESVASIHEPYYEEYYDYEDPNVDWEAVDNEYFAAYEKYEAQVDQLQNRRQYAMLIGSAMGLGFGHQLIDTWDPRPESLIFSGVYSAEFASASMFAIDAFGLSYEDSIGIVRTGIHGAMAGSLVYDHFHPVTYEQSLFTAYGSGIGHLVGSGVPFLFKSGDRAISHGVLWTGLAGTAAGTYIGDEMSFTHSDWVLNGVGFGLSAWHFAALSEVADGYELLKEDQAIGIMNTGLGLSGIGLIYAGTKTDISTDDSLFLGTTTAWGAYYGGLLPLALNLELEPHEHLLMTLVASDIGLIGGSYGVFKSGYEPKRSVLPQFLGVTGATLGALGSFLFTTDSQTVTANTLGWGTLGIAGGMIWEKTKRNNGKTKEISLLPDLNGKLAKNVRFQMAPQLDQEGNLGMYVGLYNRGF